MLKDLGVTKITIDLPFQLNHVNCFLAEGENGWTVMDTGLNNHTAQQVWEKALDGKQVDTIFISHFHPDHFGYAKGLQDKTNATLWMTKTDIIEHLTAPKSDTEKALATNYDLCGIPEELKNKMLQTSGGEFPKNSSAYPIIHHHFEEGMKVPFGKYEYEVYETPGHAEGLICLYNEQKNVLFSTDHVLPKITPNITYWFSGHPDPLAQFIESLEKIKKLEAEYVVPSHGQPFYNANKRIDEIIAHHEERLEETLDIISEPTSIYEVCTRLFRRPLNAHEIRFALGETLAHLQYLYRKGDCTREKHGGQFIFQRAK